MVDNDICMRCSSVIFAEVLDCSAASNALTALEQRFGWPAGAKLALERRFGGQLAPSWPWNSAFGGQLAPS